MKLVARYSGVAGYRTNKVGKTSEPVATPNRAAAPFGNREVACLSLYGTFSRHSVLTLKKSHEVEAGGCSNLPNASLDVNNYRCSVRPQPELQSLL